MPENSNDDGPRTEIETTSAPAPPTRGAALGLPATGPGSLAPTGRRVAALAIDWLAALLAVRLLLPSLSYGSQSAGFATLAIFAVQVTLLTWLTGSSFGQRLVGVAVRGRRHRLGLVAVALRTALVCLVIPAVVWDADGRGMHDRAVDSVVVRR